MGNHDELEVLLQKQKELSKIVGYNIELVTPQGVITEMGLILLIKVANDLAKDIIEFAYDIVKRSKGGSDA